MAQADDRSEPLKALEYDDDIIGQRAWCGDKLVEIESLGTPPDAGMVSVICTTTRMPLGSMRVSDLTKTPRKRGHTPSFISAPSDLARLVGKTFYWAESEVEVVAVACEPFRGSVYVHAPNNKKKVSLVNIEDLVLFDAASHIAVIEARIGKLSAELEALTSELGRVKALYQ